MLTDDVRITVKGGDGGNGRVSFLHLKDKYKGGPDGGNGGIGGNVYLRGINNIRALHRYIEKTDFAAENGEQGGQQKKHGRNGSDLTLTVPLGSRVFSVSRSPIDVLDEETTYLVAKGGHGGKGNWEFRSATNQAPRSAERGELGERRVLTIKLMLIADVGIIGLPNAGKSSLLNALTHANAKIGDYQFTTLEPNLGSYNGIILADIPGLIEGANTGKGLGDKFLQHVERTKVLLHCIAADSENPKKDYKIIRSELASYDPNLLYKPELVVVTKADLLSKNTKKLSVSIADDESIARLGNALEKLVKNTTSVPSSEPYSSQH